MKYASSCALSGEAVASFFYVGCGGGEFIGNRFSKEIVFVEILRAVLGYVKVLSFLQALLDSGFRMSGFVCIHRWFKINLAILSSFQHSVLNAANVLCGFQHLSGNAILCGEIKRSEKLRLLCNFSPRPIELLCLELCLQNA